MPFGAARASSQIAPVACPYERATCSSRAGVGRPVVPLEYDEIRLDPPSSQSFLHGSGHYNHLGRAGDAIGLVDAPLQRPLGTSSAHPKPSAGIDSVALGSDRLRPHRRR
eukprot:7378014-Prymnesium_polylepis.5